MFGRTSNFNDVIDKRLFKIEEDSVISPGWTTATRFEEVNIGDNEGHEINIMMPYGDKRLEFFEKAVNEEYTLEKALNVTGFAATLIPIYPDPAIVDITRKETPIVEIIPRLGTRGKSVDFNRLTAMGTTGFQAEDASLSEANDTYARKAVNVGYIYQVGRVTGQMQAATEGFVDSMNLEVMNKTKNLRYIEEQAILLGNASTGTSGNVGDGSADAPWNSAAYAGLVPQQEGLTTAAGITNPWLTSTNIVDVAGGNLSLGHIRTAIEEAEFDGGRPKVLVTDLTSVRQIKGLMRRVQELEAAAKVAPCADAEAPAAKPNGAHAEAGTVAA